MSERTRYPVDSIPPPTFTVWGLPFIDDPRIKTETAYLLDDKNRIVGVLGFPAPPPTDG